MYTWGFEADELRGWPLDLEPVPGWPPGSEPVLVHVRGAASFVTEAEAHPAANGRLVTAILYLPEGIRLTAELSGYFDAAVTVGKWEALVDLLACPERFRSEELAEDLPAAYLRRLEHPEFAGGLAIDQLPLPEAARLHLAVCETCRTAFMKSLSERMRLRRSLFCPSPERLSAYVEARQQDGDLARHLDSCPLCRAEVAALRSPWATLSDWLRLPLGFRPGTPPTGKGRLRLADGLAALVNGSILADLRPAESWARSAGGSGLEPEEALRGVLARVEAGASISLVGQNRDLTVGWDREQNALWIGHLHGDDQNRVEAFRLELRREGQVLWAAHSDAGRAFILLEALAAAFEAGADELVFACPPAPASGADRT